MKTKIQIKTIFGKVLFEYESDNNSIKKTVSGAYLSGADLSGAYLSRADLSGANLSGADLSGADLSRADLSGADLSGADLSGANLSGADLSGAYLSGADLSGAYLSGADLSGADLSGAYLSGADLLGANLSGADLSGAYLSGADLSGADLSGADLLIGKIKIVVDKATFCSNLYKYTCAAIIDNNGVEWIKLGCQTRTIADWGKNFWNNKSEFPDDGSVKSKLRVLAYNTMKNWIEINKQTK